MIYTLTPNPSLDYLIDVQDFKLGLTNRVSYETLVPGGKGINVSIVLRSLGRASTALGFIAGFTGSELEKKLKALGIHTDFIPACGGLSRINVKLKTIEGTEINGKGPEISAGELELLFRKLDALTEKDILVLAGSLPPSLPVSLYSDICRRLADQKIRILLDTAGPQLSAALPYHPFLIKPNQQELEELFSVHLKELECALPYAQQLRAQGARNVLISMGGKGAALLAEDGEFYMQDAPEGTPVNPVGAGDSMVAGFLAGWLKTRDPRYALRLGAACGSANAFCDGFASQAEILEVLHLLTPIRQP